MNKKLSLFFAGCAFLVALIEAFEPGKMPVESVVSLFGFLILSKLWWEQ